MKKILLPIDGSDSCKKSYDYAKDIAEKFNSKVVVVNVKRHYGWPYGNSLTTEKIDVMSEKYEERHGSVKGKSFEEAYTGEDKKQKPETGEFKEQYSGETENEAGVFEKQYTGESKNAEEIYADESKEHDYDKKNREIVNKAKKYFEDKDIDVETKIVHGDPATEIIKITENEEFDLVVMCTHGMSAIKRFTLGSVTNKVVHHSEAPVLIVR